MVGATQCRVEDDVASAFDEGVVQFVGPASGVLVGVACPCVGVGFAELFDIAMEFARLIEIKLDNVAGELFLNSAG
ncbi:hypothetical protein A9977_25575 [Variovorax sp. UMC13]|nr:hypothetical protein [Variovorax sp. UMC13]